MPPLLCKTTPVFSKKSNPYLVKQSGSWAVAAIFCPPGTLLLTAPPAFGPRQGKRGKENAEIKSLGTGLRSLFGQCGWRSRCVPWRLSPSSLGVVVVSADEGYRALPMEKAQALPEESHSGDEGDKYTQLMQLLSGLLLDTA